MEYEALGEDFSNRSKRSSEEIELLRKLWDEPSVTFDGAYPGDRRRPGPLPVQRPIPVWIGAASEPGCRRAVGSPTAGFR